MHDTPTLVGETDPRPGEPSSGLPGLPPRYLDRGRIGRGGTADVRRVHDDRLDRPLALKVLHADLLDDDAARARFTAEARTTAALQHPGIIPVHDEGVLADGRPWFVMPLVAGRTFGACLADLDRSRPEALRRLLDGLLRAAEAIAFAHARGVVHRDLKPANVMIGPFGEVLVMDWGLAAPPGQREPAAGTPGFMAPEQAAAEPVGPAADVHALGAMLYATLTGGAPYPGRARVALRATRRGPAPTLESRPGIDPALGRLANAALARDPADRPADGGAFAAALADALSGVRRRAEAEALLDAARALEPQMQARRADAERLAAEARDRLASVPRHAPVEQKRAAWALQDAAAEARTALALLETRWLQAVQTALERFDLPAAREALADHYARDLLDAEADGDAARAVRAEALLAARAGPRHHAVLRGAGNLTLHSDPPADVALSRWIERDRRLVPEPLPSPGATPLDIELPRGSYLLELTAPGHHPLRYPVQLTRGGHWQAIPPGASTARPVALLPNGALTPDEVAVPAGWCLVGGDPEALESLPRRRIWVEGFIITRDPITVGQWAAFLDALHPDDPDAAARYARGHTSAGPPRPLFEHTADGYRPLLAERGPIPALDWPMSGVDWHAAMAYAGWRAARDGKPWRLPGELEWEKAARGVDGRPCPWGGHLDPTRARSVDSDPRALHRVPIDAMPDDESPYGVRGLAGNVRDWCIDAWLEGGPAGDGPHRPQPAEGDALRAVRGGAWSGVMRQGRAAARFAAPPTVGYGAVGFRLARDWPATSPGPATGR